LPSYSYKIKHPNDENPRVIHSLANLVRDAQGRPVKVTGVIQVSVGRATGDQSSLLSEVFKQAALDMYRDKAENKN